MLTRKLFRRALNFTMLLAILGTVPYIVDGQTQYRHEVFGVTALALILFHCIENRGWFVQMFYRKPSLKTGGRAARFRSLITLLLTISTLIVLVSGIMISNVVFRFLGIPYQEFWHYVHFASGVAFLILVLIHMVNYRR